MLDPAGDGGVVNSQVTLSHDLFQIAIAECISQVPTGTEQNNLDFPHDAI